MNNIEVEDGELMLKNSHGDMVVVPKNKAEWARRKISEGCHNCIDELVSGLPLMSRYAEDGTLYPNEGDLVVAPPVYDINKLKKERDTFRTYMEHPSYKTRLAKEMYVDSPVDKNAVEQEYKRRAERLNSVNLEVKPDTINGHSGEYNSGTHTVSAMEGTGYHELSHAVDNRKMFIDKDTAFTGLKNGIVTYPKEQELAYRNSDVYRKGTEGLEEGRRVILSDLEAGKFAPNPNFFPAGTQPHRLIDLFKQEVSKYGDDFTLNMTTATPEYIKGFRESPHQIALKERRLAENKIYKADKLDYLSSDTEIKARINDLRLKAIEKYGHNLNKRFDINKFPELKKEEAYKELSEELKMSDEAINKLSGYVASVADINNNSNQS